MVLKHRNFAQMIGDLFPSYRREGAIWQLHSLGGVEILSS